MIECEDSEATANISFPKSDQFTICCFLFFLSFFAVVVCCFAFVFVLFLFCFCFVFVLFLFCFCFVFVLFCLFVCLFCFVLLFSFFFCFLVVVVFLLFFFRGGGWLQFRPKWFSLLCWINLCSLVSRSAMITSETGCREMHLKLTICNLTARVSWQQNKAFN